MSVMNPLPQFFLRATSNILLYKLIIMQIKLQEDNKHEDIKCVRLLHADGCWCHLSGLQFELTVFNNRNAKHPQTLNSSIFCVIMRRKLLRNRRFGTMYWAE